MFPNLWELREQLILKVNESFLILKNNPSFNPNFLGEHLKNSGKSLEVSEQWLWTANVQWYATVEPSNLCLVILLRKSQSNQWAKKKYSKFENFDWFFKYQSLQTLWSDLWTCQLEMRERLQLQVKQRRWWLLQYYWPGRKKLDQSQNNSKR